MTLTAWRGYDLNTQSNADLDILEGHQGVKITSRIGVARCVDCLIGTAEKDTVTWDDDSSAPDVLAESEARCQRHIQALTNHPYLRNEPASSCGFYAFTKEAMTDRANPAFASTVSYLNRMGVQARVTVCDTVAHYQGGYRASTIILEHLFFGIPDSGDLSDMGERIESILPLAQQMANRYGVPVSLVQRTGIDQLDWLFDPNVLGHVDPQLSIGTIISAAEGLLAS